MYGPGSRVGEGVKGPPDRVDSEQGSRRRAEAQADRGGAAAGGDQPRVGAREVDPPRPPLDAAPVVGAPAARRRPGGAVRPARRRPVVASRPVPDRGGAAGRARAAARHHRAARRVGEHRATRRCSPRRTPRSSSPPTATRRRSSTRSPAAARSRSRPSASAWRRTPPTSTRSRC